MEKNERLSLSSKYTIRFKSILCCCFLSIVRLVHVACIGYEIPNSGKETVFCSFLRSGDLSFQVGAGDGRIWSIDY